MGRRRTFDGKAATPFEAISAVSIKLRVSARTSQASLAGDEVRAATDSFLAVGLTF